MSDYAASEYRGSNDPVPAEAWIPPMPDDDAPTNVDPDQPWINAEATPDHPWASPADPTTWAETGTELILRGTVVTRVERSGWLDQGVEEDSLYAEVVR